MARPVALKARALTIAAMRWPPVRGVVVTAFIAMQLVDKLSFRIIDKSRWIRRLVAGSEDIEGDWVDVIADPKEPTKKVSAEYLRIRFRNGQHVVSGEGWSLDGEWRGRFETKGGDYIGR